MKNGIFMAIVLAVWGFLKLFFKLLKTTIQVLSSLFVFLGLYIPLFYVFFGLILLAATDFTFGGTGTDQILYYIGLALCCVASAIITIRNLLVRPISSIFASFRKPKEPSYSSDRDRSDRRPRYAIEAESADRSEYRRRDGACFYREDDYGYGESYPSDRSRDRGDFYGERRERPDEDRYERADRFPPFPDGPASRMDSYRDDPYRKDPYSSERAEKPLVYHSKRRPGVLVKEYSDRFELFSDGANGVRYLGTEYKDE